MFKIYLEEINGIWFGVTITNKQILSTAFSLSKDRVKTRLVNKLPSNGSVKFYKKPSRVAKNIFTSMKLIFNGNDDEKKI